MSEVIHARVEQTHKSRIMELRQATGLSESAVIRKLIEYSRLELLPTPASAIPTKSNGDGIRQDVPVAITA